MIDETLNWESAKSHLDDWRREYTDVGVKGIPSLRLFIDPLLVRYERGERTKELYDEIMSIS